MASDVVSDLHSDELRSKSDRSTLRVVAVLDRLARTPPGGIGVRQLAAELELSRSTVHRILQSLAELHVARLLPSGSYAAGSLMVSWGAFLADRHSMLTAADDVLAKMVDELREAVYLFSYESPNHHATVVARRQCDKPVQYVLELGSTAPLHVGAAGKAILAYLPDSILDDLQLGQGPEASAPTKAALRKDMAETRSRGYAVSIGERIPEACGVAACFFIDGRPGGSIDISVPRYRMDMDRVDGYGRLAAAAAANLSRLLAP